MIFKIAILLTIFLSQNVFGQLFRIAGGSDAHDQRKYFVKCSTTDWICRGTTDRNAASLFIGIWKTSPYDDPAYFQLKLYNNGATRFCLNIWGGKIVANLYPCTAKKDAKENELWYRDSGTQYLISPYYPKYGGSVLWWNGANNGMTIISRDTCNKFGDVSPLIPKDPKCQWILESL